MTDELQEHLNKGMYGTPKLKPDEQRKYLGTFRERVDLTVTFAQLNSEKYYPAIQKELEAPGCKTELPHNKLPNKLWNLLRTV